MEAAVMYGDRVRSFQIIYDNVVFFQMKVLDGFKPAKRTGVSWLLLKVTMHSIAVLEIVLQMGGNKAMVHCDQRTGRCFGRFFVYCRIVCYDITYLVVYEGGYLTGNSWKILTFDF